ncbi:MAG TPA: protein kinase [Pyrinomonadaceae bacterium]|nr:protein kinase [Pyrinomonadaceae bacterium]
MFCPKCNINNSGDHTFCVQCGAALSAVTENLDYSKENYQNSSSVSSWFGTPDGNLNGRTLDGKYQIEAKLGTGGAGAVYLATRLHIGDKVAVKVLRNDKSDDPQVVERFRLEAQLAAHLKHPNAVSIYDYGVTSDGLRYLVMEFVEGRTLRQLIAQQGALPALLVAEIAVQICAALDEAHRLGLIHRDIKPDNIIVQETSTALRVKVLDFGIAKLSSMGASNLTQTGTIVGTPRYMSPEQCMGEHLDGRSDIYSLGIVLYEMLCGIVPFNAPSSTAIAVQQVTQQPPSLCQNNPNVPQAVEAIVLRALEKKREARPSTAAEFAKELAGVVKNQTEFTRQNILFNFTNPTNEALQPSLTSENQPPTVFMPSYSDQQKFNPSSGFVTNVQPPKTKGKKRLLLTVAVIFGFLIFSGIGAMAMWLLLRQPTVIVKNTDDKISNTNSVNEKPLFVGDENTKVTKATPSTNPADSEFERLHNTRINAKAEQIDKIADELENAEKKYPADYRFPYEGAKLLAPSSNHHQAFHALAEAARTAIKNNQASEILSNLSQNKNTDFRRLTGHQEWTAIENALSKKDSSLLPKDED